MRIQITLGEVHALADLFPEKAPRTVPAFLDLLPLEGPAVHGRWSGQVFWIKRPLPDLPEENPVHLLPPGALVVLPGAGEIMVSVGEAAVHNALGLPRTANWIGQVVANLEPLCAIGRELQVTGSRPVRFGRAAGT